MARIVGGIGASHAPSMEHVYDAGEEVRLSDEWQPLFGPFQQVAGWLEELRPDRLIVIYNDHMDGFFLDAYPTFALGMADEYPIADEGFGAIVINPGALSHYSEPLHDAIAAASVPAIEVHQTNIYAREEFRRHSTIAPACRVTIAGAGAGGYHLALEAMPWITG